MPHRLSITVDGVPHHCVIEPGDMLLDVMRREGYFSVKRGCETGECGSCTVQLDGRAVNSCLVFAAIVNGCNILTVGGIASLDHLDSMQQKFLEGGAAQCGFCTPGMILNAHAAVAKERCIGASQARSILRGNLCRCTGYSAPTAALISASRESSSAGVRMPEPQATTLGPDHGGNHAVVGRSVPKVDSKSLVTGVALFTDDVNIPGLLYGKILRSPYAHARLRTIDVSEARQLRGVRCVLTYKDVPHVPHTTAGQIWPEPSPYDTYLLDSKVRFVGDRVAVVAAENRAIAEEAIRRIRVDYEILPAVLDPEQAMLPMAPLVHDEPESSGLHDLSRNLAAHIMKNVGNVKAGFKAADVILQKEYRTQRVQHCSIEPHIAITWLDSDARLNVRTSSQVPFHIRRQLALILAIPIERIRVLQPHIGGGFGGKQELVVEDLCGVLTLKTGCPVKIEYTREEEFFMARSRHPQILRLGVGARKNGTILAIQMDVIATTGAYGGHAVTVQGNTGSKVLALYRAPHKKYECHIVYTNTPVAGAFRGYGCPQGFFALESLLDEVAYELRMDPIEFRKNNIVRLGEVDHLTFAGELGERGRQRRIRSCGLPECLDRAKEAFGWSSRKRSNSTASTRRGRGVAFAMQGTGIIGVSWSSAWLRLEEDGRVVVHTGASEIGTGAHTVLSQIAAEVLGITMDRIIVRGRDTDVVPFDVGAYASGTTVIAGEAVKRASVRLRQRILQLGARMLRTRIANLSCKNSLVVDAHTGRSLPISDIGRHSIYEYKQQIMATASHCSKDSPPPFCVQMAEVEVDTETGNIDVLRTTTAVDLGFAINPALAVGQVDGAVAQGLGYALMETMALDNKGVMINANFRDYHLPRSVDMPEMQTILVEAKEPQGPFGAKAVGEVAINVVAPAVANAIFDAIGVRFRQLPITAEVVWRAMRSSSLQPHDLLYRSSGKRCS